MESECSNHAVDRNLNVVVRHCDNAITIEDVDEVIKRECTEDILPHSTPPLVSPNDMDSHDSHDKGSHRPYIAIVEQPATKSLRFRYECEGRSAGSLPGAHSTPENRTFPTIQIVNCKVPAVVVASCVTKDQPYRPHPHKLVGRESCTRGVCTIKLNSENMICQFSNVGIQCVKKKDIEGALKEREKCRVDPFRTGFDHSLQNIDLNAVKLCFQAFLEGPEKGKFTVPVPPVVSDTIFDKKAMSELTIVKLSGCSGSVKGGTELILLCEKVSKDDVEIRFYEEKNDQILWEACGEFQPNDVHKQVAISFKTPPYHNQDIQQPVEVFLQLRKRSDLSCSDPRIFQYTPLDLDPERIEQKRRKVAAASLQSYLEQNTGMSYSMENPMGSQANTAAASDFSEAARLYKIPSRGRRTIKQENDPSRVLPPSYQQYQPASYAPSTSYEASSISFGAASTSYTMPSTSFASSASLPVPQQQQAYFQCPPTIRSPFEALKLSPGPSPMLSGAVGGSMDMAVMQSVQGGDSLMMPPRPAASPSPTLLLLESRSDGNYGNDEEKKKLMEHLQQQPPPTGDQMLNSADLNFPSIDSGDFASLLQSDAPMNPSLNLSSLDAVMADASAQQTQQQHDVFGEVHNEIMQLNQLGQTRQPPP